MNPALEVKLSVGNLVAVGAGVGGVGGLTDVFEKWSMQNATLIITNPTEQTWTYTVNLVSGAFLSLPFFTEETLGPGASATKTITLTMSGPAGVTEVYVHATEDTTGRTLYDGYLIDTITIIETMPELDVSIAWDDSSKAFDQFTTQWATLTITNPTTQTFTYNVFLLSSAFILGLPPFWEQTLGPGATATARVGPLMTGAAGAHDVTVTVEEVPGTTIIDNRYLDTIAINVVPPEIDVGLLAWDNAQPFTRYTTQWGTLPISNPTDQTWTYSVRLACDAFAIPSGFAQDKTIGPGGNVALRDGPFINGAAGTYNVFAVVTVNGVEIYNAPVGSVTVAQPIPAMDLSFGWE